MFNVGMPELVMVLVVVLIIFGPSKLPEIGKAVGKSIRGFKEETNNVKEEVHKVTTLEAPPAKDETRNP